MNNVARRVAVVLPAYNEEGAIAATVSDTLAKLPDLVHDFVVVVVDDGSKDRTAEILADLAHKHGSMLSIVSNGVNLGYGGALRVGFERALTFEPDYVFWMDSDGQFDIADFALLISRLPGADVVVGYRMHRSDPLIRLFNAEAWRLLVRALFGIRARDIDCAFKLVRADFFSAVSLRSTGAVISTEILAQVKRAGLGVVEVGVNHYPRMTGRPTGASPAVIIRALRELVSLRMALINEPVPEVRRSAPQVELLDRC